jgi:hypothetical protein
MEMSDRSYRRLTRYAVFAAASIPLALILLAIPRYGPGLFFLLGVLPVWFLAIGPYQADLALNVGLTDDERRWWRIVLFLLPWSMALYWRQHVRR